MASATTKKGCLEKISCRQVLNIMVIIGFMINYMLRVNITIAITAMVPSPTTNVTNNTDNATMEPTSELFNWDKYQQNMILGSFFWGYVLTELPGGHMADAIGGHKIFGGGTLAASILTLLTPLACYWGFVPVVLIRALLGFFLGATWPALPPIAAKWIPPMERSKFVANMMASSLGAAITMPVCGLLIDKLGWASVFYLTGGLSLVWSVAWFFVVFDSPATHPRCSAEERMEIETAIAQHTKGKKPKNVPWKAIFTSLPVWAIVVTHGCSVFGYFTVVNQLPTYFKDVLKYNIKENGLYSSLPYLGKYLMAIISSYLADKLRRNGKFTTTFIRKSFTTFAVGFPAGFMVLQAFFGQISAISITIFTCSLFFNGAVTAGYLANGLDIAPNFSGTIFGMANTLSSMGGYISTAIVAALTNKSSTFSEWKWVFWILAGNYALGTLVYLIFGTGKLQGWNSVERRQSENGVKSEQELEPLKKKNGEIPA
nr:sialin [Onthophagus taurus]